MPPIGYPGNSVSKAARAKAGGGFESAINAAGNGISGIIEDGQTITIASDGFNGFGSGSHSVQVFDDMRNGISGERQGENDAVIGTYIGTGGGFGGEYSELYSHSKGRSLKQFDGATLLNRGSWANIVPSQQVLMSYWVFVPSGFGLPGMDNNAYTPGGSNWKLAWIGADQDSFGAEGKPDTCVPTNNSGNALTMGGNESTMAAVQNYTQLSQVHTYGEWLWCCVLFDAVNHRYLAKHISKSKGLKEFSLPVSGIWGSTSPQEIGHVRFNGFVRTAESANCQLYYDDFYTATGSAAGGIVLIGDNPVFANCTDFAVQKINTRSNSSISVDVQSGPFSSLTGKYLFVLDSDLNPINYGTSEGREISA